jgi:hypothetical protein
MATEQIIKRCTSERFSDPDNKGKFKPCNLPLLRVINTQGEPSAWICEYCDSLEWLPKSMRGRIFEQ